MNDYCQILGMTSSAGGDEIRKLRVKGKGQTGEQQRQARSSGLSYPVSRR